MVAEISDGFAVAVSERSLPHFRLRTQEVYRVLRGHSLRGMRWPDMSFRKKTQSLLSPDRSTSLEQPENLSGLEVESVPPYSADDHFIL